MNTDTIFEKLIETGMKPEQAKLIAELQRDNDYIHYGELKYLATKEYIQKELKDTINVINNNIKNETTKITNDIKKELTTQINTVNTNLTTQINNINTNLTTHYATKNDVSKSTNKILVVLITVIGLGVSILGYLITHQNTPNNKQQQTISRNH